MSELLTSIRLAELLQQARAKNASDLHVIPGRMAALRVDGKLEAASGVTSPEDCEFIAGQLLHERALERLSKTGDTSASYRRDDLGSFRVHAYRTVGGISLAVRLLATSVPALETLHLPGAVADFAGRQSGLVLFAGPTGSGKTTALAALIDRINRNEAKHIITIEDPIEYEHTSHKAIVSQREVGSSVGSFHGALTGALRSDPDVIMVGEMRDAPTMRAALTAAETGHLVFATLHTGDSSQTIDRILDAVPPEAQSQVRVQLSQTLVGVVCLRLIRRLNAPGRRAAAEVLVANDAIRNLIRDAKTYQVRNVVATGRQWGMQTLEASLSELAMRGEVALCDARAATDRPADVRELGRKAS